FLRKLASVDRSARDSAIDVLEKYVSGQKVLPQKETDKLWKGLYYAMYLADRPKYQHELADRMSNLVLIVNEKSFDQFVASFWKVHSAEWSRLDRHRLDKYLYLIRRTVNAMFTKVARSHWTVESAEKIAGLLRAHAFALESTSAPNGIRLHLLDIYLDELESVIGDTDRETIKTALDIVAQPFIEVADCRNKVLRKKFDEDVKSDKRLVEWGLYTPIEPESEDEWAGF
ncbi:hypothetical protein CANCADRAFT_14591, partial [Tortispora caseinolytica NRRL Y-17796]